MIDPDLSDIVEKIKAYEQNIIFHNQDDVERLVFKIKEGLATFKKRKMEIEYRINMLTKMATSCAEQRNGINLSNFETVFVKVNTLRSGQSFGELALISKKGLRTASIRAQEKTYLGVIS